MASLPLPETRVADLHLDKLREECGVVGVIQQAKAAGVAAMTCRALQSLQHRGEEGAGMVVSDSAGLCRDIKGLGLVTKVFDEPEKLHHLKGTCGLGHVRYGTAGGSVLENVQPFGTVLPDGKMLWLAHNGSLVNHEKLKAQLEAKGYEFKSNSDSEVVLHLVADEQNKQPGMDILSSISIACEQLDGAYSLVFLVNNTLVAVRDARGFRPLVIGLQDDGSVVFASETCSLDSVDARYLREVEPGEIVVASETSKGKVAVQTVHRMKEKDHRFCMFELFYLSRQDSVVFGHSVYKTRYSLGELLAEDAPCDCDFAMPVPDSGMVSLLGYASKANLPIHHGFIRRHYEVGRTFIQPKEVDRTSKVRLKLVPVAEILRGKKVAVVDDSLVRGTTSKVIVEMLRKAGAKEVHVRIPSPPVIHPCFYGVDTPTQKELLLSRMNVEEAAKYLGADSLAFLSLDRIKQKLGNGHEFCDACFTGNRPC